MDAADICRVSTATLVTCYFPLFFCEKEKIVDNRRNLIQLINGICMRLILFVQHCTGVNDSETEVPTVIIIGILNVFGTCAIDKVFAVRT